MARRTDPNCPACGAGMIPVEYGLPGEELIEAAERGEVRIGGCTVEPDSPDFVCLGTESHEWERDASGRLMAIDRRDGGS